MKIQDIVRRLIFFPMLIVGWPLLILMAWSFGGKDGFKVVSELYSHTWNGFMEE